MVGSPRWISFYYFVKVLLSLPRMCSILSINIIIKLIIDFERLHFILNTYIIGGDFSS